MSVAPRRRLRPAAITPPSAVGAAAGPFGVHSPVAGRVHTERHPPQSPRKRKRGEASRSRCLAPAPLAGRAGEGCLWVAPSLRDALAPTDTERTRRPSVGEPVGLPPAAPFGRSLRLTTVARSVPLPRRRLPQRAMALLRCIHALALGRGPHPEREGRHPPGPHPGGRVPRGSGQVPCVSPGLLPSRAPGDQCPVPALRGGHAATGPLGRSVPRGEGRSPGGRCHLGGCERLLRVGGPPLADGAGMGEGRPGCGRAAVPVGEGVGGRCSVPVEWEPRGRGDLRGVGVPGRL